tara:strand:+ start:32 stop:1312 length:1281 start_codon:yes stop_codon:yes gene_type:complete
MESINSKYNISEINIGHGSFSTVYLGNNKIFGFDVAIKKINKKKINSLQENFKNDIEIMKKLSHPHIVKTFDILEDPNYIFIALEYCKNGTLHSFLNKRPLKEEHVKKFGSQITSALKYLFELKILHRDLKPQNILLDYQNNIKLTDFDFAKIINDDNLFKTICGTPLYMAPEIIKYKKYNNKSDLWSLGIILYQMITGKHPYKAKTHFELVKKIESEHIVIPKKFDISKECFNLIHSLLQKEEKYRLDWEELFTHPWILSSNYFIDYSKNNLDINNNIFNNVDFIDNVKNVNTSNKLDLSDIENSFNELNFDDLFESNYSDSFKSKNNTFENTSNNNNKYKNIINDNYKSKPISIINNDYFDKNNSNKYSSMFNTPINRTPSLSDGFILVNTPNQNKHISKSKLGNTLFNYMDNSFNYLKSFFIK